MADNERKITIVIGGDAAGGVKAIDETEAAGSKLGSIFGSIGKTAAIGFGAVAAATVVGGAALFKLGENFDAVYDQFRIKNGAVGGQLEILKDDFRNVVQSVPTDFGKAGDAISMLQQRTGAVGPVLEGLAKQELELSRITKTDLSGNIKSSQDAFNNWGVDVAKQGPKLDLLFRASQQSGVGVADLASSLASGGVQLRAAGLDFDQATALVASLGKAGVDVSDIMPALGKSMAAAAKEGKSAQDVFKATFDRIKSAPDDTAAAGAALDVFGAKAGPKLAALIREGKLSYEDLQRTITGGKDTIVGAGKDTMDFGEKWELLKNRVLVGLEPVATGVFNAIGAGMDFISPKIGPIVEGVSAIASAIGGLFSGNLASAGVDIGTMLGFSEDSSQVNTIITTLETVRAKFSDVFSSVRQIVGDVVTQITAWWDQHRVQITAILQQLGAVFGSAFGAIQAIVTVAVIILTDLWDRFGSTLVEKLKIALDAILLIVKGALEILQGVFDLIKAVLTGKWGQAWDAIKEILHGAWDAIIGILRLGIDEISYLFELAKAVVSAAWSAIWHGIATIVTDVVIDPAKKAFNGLVDFVGSLPSRIADAASGMWDGIKDAFRAALNWIIRAWNSLKFEVPGVKVFGKEIGGFTIGVPPIPLLAAGTNDWPGGLAIVGDAGPELVNLPAHSQVIPNDRLGALGTSGPTIHIEELHLNGVQTPEDLVEQLVAYANRNGPLPAAITG